MDLVAIKPKDADDSMIVEVTAEHWDECKRELGKAGFVKVKAPRKPGSLEVDETEEEEQSETSPEVLNYLLGQGEPLDPEALVEPTPEVYLTAPVDESGEHVIVPLPQMPLEDEHGNVVKGRK